MIGDQGTRTKCLEKRERIIVREMSAAESWLPGRRVADWQQCDIEGAVGAPQYALDERVCIGHECRIAGEEQAFFLRFGEVHVRRASPTVDPVAIALVRSTLGMEANRPSGNCRLRTNEAVAVSGATARSAGGENPNPLFRIVAAGKPIIAASGALAEVNLRPTQTVDFPTVAGSGYTVTPVGGAR